MDEKILKDAQYRKGLSIAFFNATNAAIALCTGMNVHEEATFKKIQEIRDLFLEEHKNYYAKVIANVGVNFKTKDTIEKLSKAKNLEELKSLWLSLSEDERRDDEILKVKATLKTKYEKS